MLHAVIMCIHRGLSHGNAPTDRIELGVGSVAIIQRRSLEPLTEPTPIMMNMVICVDPKPRRGNN